MDVRDLVALAASEATPAGFRHAALSLLRPTLGFDAGVIMTHDRCPPRLDDAGFVNQSAADLAIFSVERVSHELAPVMRELARSHVANPERVLPARDYERMLIVSALFGPRRWRSPLLGRLRFSPGDCADVMLVREGRGFSDKDAQRYLGLMPMLALADFAVRARARRPALDVGDLKAADRELVEWVALGYTNAQIALVSHRSHHAVRNRLARLFAKHHVASRAELVARFAARAPW